MEEKIEELTQILTSTEVPEICLFTGVGGQILACGELFSQNKISQNQLTHLFQILEEQLSNEEFTFTHCSGLAGIGWLYEHLSQRKIIDYDTNLLLEDFDICLEKALNGFMRQGNYDFLHGGVGVALYFAKRVKKKKELVRVLNEFLVNLEKTSTKQEDGTIKWLSVLNPETYQQGYNLSLSHGMASIVAILSKLYKIEGIDKEKTEKLLRGTAQYILAQEIDVGKFGCFFSNYAIESTPTIAKSRLGWCYGDLGIATSLYQAGTVLKEQNWCNKAIEVLRYAAMHRKSLVDNSVNDAGLCHGAAGIGHIFYRMWWNTRLPQFKEAADYWFEQTLKMAVFDDGLAGYKTLHLEKYGGWVNEYGLLEGVSGIALSLLTYHYELEPEWDECLLLS